MNVCTNLNLAAAQHSDASLRFQGLEFLELVLLRVVLLRVVLLPPMGACTCVRAFVRVAKCACE